MDVAAVASDEVLFASRADALADPAFWFVVMPVGMLTIFVVGLVRKRMGAEKTRGWRATEYILTMVAGLSAWALSRSVGFGG